MSGLVIMGLIAVAIGVTAQMGRRVIAGYNHYRILKGRHRSTQNGKPSLLKFGFAPKYMRFSVIFDRDCMYEDNNNGDLNKLYGMSYGFDNHYRSVRFAWFHNKATKQIAIYAYLYDNGKRMIEYICSIDPDYEHIFSIVPQPEDKVFMSVSTETRRCIGKKLLRLHHKDSWFRLKQFPYFGGNNPAPSTMNIYINDNPK